MFGDGGVEVTKGCRNSFEKRISAKINNGNIFPNGMEGEERGNLGIDFPSSEIDFSALNDNNKIKEAGQERERETLGGSSRSSGKRWGASTH